MDEAARPGNGPGVPAEIPLPTQPLDRILQDVIDARPDHLFADFLGSRITYGELGEQIAKAACALHIAGVRRGDRVSLVMPNCPQHVVAFYATLRLGAVVSEHNPLATADELQAQFALGEPTVIIAWENAIEKVAPHGPVPGRTVFAMNLTAALPRRSRLLLSLPLPAARAQRAVMRAPVPRWVLSWEDEVAGSSPVSGSIPGADVDDTACLIFTGGTTGAPKAVELSHLNAAVNAAQARAWVTPLREGEEVILAALPFFHAFGLTLALTLAPILSASLLILPRFDVDLVLAAHKRLPITFAGGVPPMFDRLETAAREQGVDLSTIGFSVSGAMSLDPDIARRWEDITGGYLVEGYGMSECSPVIGANPMTAERRPGYLGIPFPSTQMRLCDPESPTTEVPLGEVGEIQAHGPQVMRGYYKAPEATAEIMTEDGWLRTGDLAVQDETGWYRLTDRIKEVIISGGFNIYPSQVEDAVREMPGVTDVAVVGLPDASRGEQVVAALVMEPGASVNLDQVRAWAEKRISHYALPRQIAVLDELPRSQLGKVLRRKVSEQLQHAGDRIDDARVQWAETKEHLGEQWAETREQLGEQFAERRAHMGERIDEARDHLAERRTQRTGKHAADVPADAGAERGTPSDAPGASLGEPDDLNSDTVDPSVSGDGVTGAIDEENPGR